MAVGTLKSISKKYSLDDAFAYCAAVSNAHYENFPVASFFLPSEKRPYIQAIYAFSRTADDMVDEANRSPEERLIALNDWEFQLQECFEGRAEHPVFISLQETINKNGIPIDPLRSLIIAFKQDVTQNRYESFEQLLRYCSNSANPVGRLVLMVFGYRDEKLLALSDKICTALQLTNFWQDVGVDLSKDRLYIPLEDIRKFGYGIDEWKRQDYDERFRKLLMFQIDRTREMFYEGAELPTLVDRDLELELKLIWFGGMTILRQVEKNNYDVFHRRPILNLPQKLLVLLKGLWHSDLVHFKRKVRKPLWDLT